MRLSICLLVVTLALCCYEDNALVCPDVITVSSNFLLGFYSTLKWQLQKYNAPPEAVAAKLKVKECIDTIPYLSRVSVEAAEARMVKKCVLSG